MPLKAVALMGATGTGKSALALALAESAGTPIVCCDSMQVYRGLDIGTAKPSPTEQSRVPHTLIDCCTLPDAFSAARWATLAGEVIRGENEAGRVPLIAGGTGLYLKALTEGLAEIPPEKPEVRQALLQRLHDEGIASLHAELARVDAPTAARLAHADMQRILRALAVYHSSGRSLSAWHGESAMPPQTEIPVFVLQVEREALRLRIARRFEAMLAAGWLDEVRWLDGLGLPATHPAMRAVGYRQLLAHVRGECGLEDATNAGITATRRYAKRQQTWFAHQTPDAVHADADTLAPLLAEALKR
jgi:tRNA dimethylallyltransferase